MNDETLLSRIRALVIPLCRERAQGFALDDDTDLFEVGLLTSLHALRLVESVERALGLAVPDGELKLANFRSVRTIAALVTRLAP